MSERPDEPAEEWFDNATVDEYLDWLASVKDGPDFTTEPYELDGCTCSAVAGSHKPPCQWAAKRDTPDAPE